ncbi:arsenite efflux membrane protein ArsB [Jatrophihabitans sp. GAS493]|uniref:SLC13 family permease n=1 Tax=Jatrophihabitans sp. GAS493 TaxID=1907575 RepID=UPI000BB71D72|nr:SLC13 family permease [Jatrophihabitans sp. GAS493]SOD71412.1 arsenite efflux membrane protein ArsB [Jatrophihabitans sp. GAS493]
MWAILGLAGLVVVVTGWLPPDRARDVAITRAGPILVFLLAITVLAELADRAGVFDAAARACARAARGSTIRLFLLISLLGTLTTIGMSLDTTAVLLTPVVLSLTDRLGLRPLPFALLAVWLANTASLLLPVSNLTNLLAVQHASISALRFAGRMALPEVVAVSFTVIYLGFLYRRDLRTRYTSPEPVAPEDIWTFRVCALACIALAPGVLAGAAPWAVAVGCAGAATVVFLIRQRRALSWSLLPWRILVLTEGLFLTVSALADHGGTRLIERLTGDNTLATTAVSAGASNAVNNLPAYLAVETTIPPGHTTQLFSALLGTNAGPLVLLWGSLATLLWRERCKARGVHVSAWTFAAVGIGGVPLMLLGTWGALLVTGTR